MATEDIVARLEAALGAGSVPEAARKRGQALLDSLSRPVRVALVGPEGSGKTCILNLFLGHRLLPEELGARVIEVVHADAFVAEAAWLDGRLEAPEEDELAEIRDADTLLVAAPYEILRRLVFVEGRSDDPDTLSELIGTADIVLWCSSSFSKAERAAWALLEEAHRDHGFLLLTKADKLARKQRLAEVMAELAPIAEAEFEGLYPLATLQALKALDATPRDRTLWDGSGAEALTRAVLDHASKGRQADLDQAELFLARYGLEADNGEGAGETAPRARSRPRSEATRRRSRLTRQPTRPVTHAEAVPPEGPAAAPPPPAPDPSPSLAHRLGEIRRTPSRVVAPSDDVAAKALARLREAGKRLAGLSGDPGAVLDLCAETADALQDIVEGGTLPADLAHFADDLAQTGEMMTLLRLENAPGPAADAVTILLQLRRDLEQPRAA